MAVTAAEVDRVRRTVLRENQFIGVEIGIVADRQGQLASGIGNRAENFELRRILGIDRLDPDRRGTGRRHIAGDIALAADRAAAAQRDTVGDGHEHAVARRSAADRQRVGAIDRQGTDREIRSAADRRRFAVVPITTSEVAVGIPLSQLLAVNQLAEVVPSEFVVAIFSIHGLLDYSGGAPMTCRQRLHQELLVQFKVA